MLTILAGFSLLIPALSKADGPLPSYTANLHNTHLSICKQKNWVESYKNKKTAAQRSLSDKRTAGNTQLCRPVDQK